MQMVCPVCNKMNDIEYNCNKCGAKMVEKGRKQEYYDDYSADHPIDDAGNYCVHLFRCTKCHNMEQIKIKKRII